MPVLQVVQGMGAGPSFHPAILAKAYGHCSERWPSRGALVCHAGLHGNEGKSFLLKPLLKVYGAEGVFVAPPSKSAFPFMGLEKARAWLCALP